ncbi:hydroxysteroid (20-beta) dehydrogenase 2 [Alosa pseudoharengus]|uniref:hydroxysteroid (20-beta) dehydrogenase 2 n=1 Tax=Alosa pseudoharengus TaxID=34774 RepID=UPI003F895F96
MELTAKFPSAEKLVFVVGYITLISILLKWSWKCWCGFRVYVLSEFRQTDLRVYGQWAVVTGSTSGIGLAYASELARRGLDIVLISRSMKKLQDVAAEIENRYGRQTRVIQTDFTEGHQIYPAIAKNLKGLNIGILVNNIGLNYSGVLANFLDVPNCEQKITQMINCNILSLTQMTRIVLPDMVERGRGLIINMSSECASQPQPMVTMYCATKIFMNYFSRCLNAEYRSDGITVQCVAPLLVHTNMTQHMGMNPLMKSAPEFAREALNTVGYSTYTSGCMSHALQHIALSVFLPDWVRLSPFCMKHLQKYALSVHQQLKEALAEYSNKEE